MEGALITAVRWIPRGSAKADPSCIVMDEKDVKEIVKEMKEIGVQIDPEIDENDQLETNLYQNKSDMLNSDESDNDTTTDNNDEHDKEKGDATNISATGDFPGSQFFSTLEADLPNVLSDPFLKDISQSDSEDEDDRDANHIYPSDCPLIACSTDPDLPTLEVYIYDHETGAFFIHHDINVGAPPLCVEWLDQIATTSYPTNNGHGSFAAVGSFGHGMIEIWNLDVMDEIEPVLVLGDHPSDPSGVRRKKKSTKKRIQGHAAPVLSLHKNPHRSGVLASGSADETVKIWDLLSPACVETLTHHTDKVQTLKWHPIEEPILLTAAYDKTLGVVDVRAPGNALRGTLHADAESCCWNRHEPAHCWVSAEDGSVSVYDLRTLSNDARQSNALYHLNAHTAACTGVTDSQIPGLIMTCSLSGHAKVWNSKDLTLGVPAMVFERDLKAGPLFSVNSNPDELSVFSFGGGVVVIWDVGDSNPVNIAFSMPVVESTEIGAFKKGPTRSKDKLRRNK